MLNADKLDDSIYELSNSLIEVTKSNKTQHHKNTYNKAIIVNSNNLNLECKFEIIERDKSMYEMLYDTINDKKQRRKILWLRNKARPKSYRSYSRKGISRHASESVVTEKIK